MVRTPRLTPAGEADGAGHGVVQRAGVSDVGERVGVVVSADGCRQHRSRRLLMPRALPRQSGLNGFGVVTAATGQSRRTGRSQSRDAVERSADLRRLDEHHVVEAADLTEHEVARCGVLRDLDPLRGVTEAAALVRVDEADVRLTEARDVLGGEHLDGVLHRSAA